jgi:hypothetical protein
MRSILTFLVAAALAVGCGAFIWRERNSNQQAAAALTRAESSHLQLAEALRSANSRLLALQRQIEARKIPTPSAHESNTPSSPPIATVWSREEANAKDPKIQLAQIALLRARLATKYGPLFQALHLSPPQISAFEDNVEKRDTASTDTFYSVVAQGLSVGDPGFKTLVGSLHLKIDADYAAAQQGLLGQDQFQQLQDYERTIDVRSIVGAIAGAGAMAGVSFTSQEAEQLVGVIANADTHYRDGQEALAYNADWSQADVGARAILSDAQFSFFQTYASRGGNDRSSSALSRAVNDANVSEKTPGATPTN